MSTDPKAIGELMAQHVSKTMSEAWQKSVEPTYILRILASVWRTDLTKGDWRWRCLRMFINACFRRNLSGAKADATSRTRSVEAAERWADGGPMPAPPKYAPWSDVLWTCINQDVWGAAREQAVGDYQGRKDLVADILRDVVGNPFDPPRLHVELIPGAAPSAMLMDGTFVEKKGDLYCPVVACPWIDRTAWELAETIYDERRLNDLPVLADRLEERGCDDARLLEHLRTTETTRAIPGLYVCEACGETNTFLFGQKLCKKCGEEDRHRKARVPMIHVRGCWALDLVRGKR